MLGRQSGLKMSLAVIMYPALTLTRLLWPGPRGFTWSVRALAVTPHWHIFTMVTVVTPPHTVWTGRQSCLQASTSDVIQPDSTSTSNTCTQNFPIRIPQHPAYYTIIETLSEIKVSWNNISIMHGEGNVLHDCFIKLWQNTCCNYNSFNLTLCKDAHWYLAFQRSLRYSDLYLHAHPSFPLSRYWWIFYAYTFSIESIDIPCSVIVLVEVIITDCSPGPVMVYLYQSIVASG